jgi:uncharacterized protein (TIGR03083 family)
MARRRTTAAQARQLLKPSVAAVQHWLDALWAQDAVDRAAPSVLPGWSLRDLAAHLVLVADSVVHLKPLAAGAPVLSVAEYLAGYPAGAGAIAERTRALAASTDDLPGELGQRWGQAWERLDELGGVTSVQARRGPIRLADFLVTRVLEIVVHADDLARSVPGRDAPPVPPQAERLVVRVLLECLAERHPGQALEVRVPPVAAVQCLPGPRHTRGTPPGVVETEPRTWLRLAAGRVPWDAAVAAGDVRASGERADLAAVLPLL